MNINKLPRQTAQVLAVICIVLLLIAAIWMAVITPEMKKAPDEFDKTYVYQGTAKLLNQQKFTSLEDPLDVYSNAQALHHLEANNKKSSSDHTFYHDNFSVWAGEDDPTVIAPLFTIRDGDYWLDRNSYETRKDGTSVSTYEHAQWGLNLLPKDDQDYKFANPLNSDYDNTYVFVDDDKVEGVEAYIFDADERATRIPYSSERLAPLVTQLNGELYLDYYERVKVAVDTGVVLNREYDVKVMLSIPNLLYLQDDYSSVKRYEGTVSNFNSTDFSLDEINVTGEMITTAAGTGNLTHINMTGVLSLYHKENGMFLEELANSTVRVNRVTHEIEVMPGMEMATFFSVKCNDLTNTSCRVPAANATYPNSLVSTHMNQYTFLGTQDYNGTTTYHFQAVETNITYGTMPHPSDPNATLNLTMDYTEEVYIDPLSGTVIDQDYAISIKAVELGDLTVKTIDAGFTDAYITDPAAGSLYARGKTLFAMKYANSDISVLELQGQQTNAQMKANADESQQRIEDLTLLELYVPSLLIILALVALAGSFYVYYQTGEEQDLLMTTSSTEVDEGAEDDEEESETEAEEAEADDTDAEADSDGETEAEEIEAEEAADENEDDEDAGEDDETEAEAKSDN